MKKAVMRTVSCLLCAVLLWGAAAPAGALQVREEEMPGGETSGDYIPVSAELTEAAGEYEIYPTPHSVAYADPAATVTLPDTMQVTYEAGIDSYTRARADEAFQAAGVSLDESASTAVQLRVGIKDSGGAVDTYFTGKTAATADLFTKNDAYWLIINDEGVAVLGRDTDAAFYGLTTVKRILQQVDSTTKQVRQLTVEDYSDVAFRGFIEGYYGNPWSVEDRCELMRFGGELKMNIYFYAPKDDPKHNAQWRDLYTDEEIRDKIAPLAQAGNESKCYFGYALHPFMYDPITEATYTQDLADIKAKFTQVLDAGVRQIAVLADDAGVPGATDEDPAGHPEVYVRLMNDLTTWVSSDAMQAAYSGLKVSIPFCPADYMGNGSSAQVKMLAPAGTQDGQVTGDVPIIMTGGTIWGTVNSDFVGTFFNNVGVGPYYWVNWPCSDNSKGSLTMGAQDIILKRNVDPAKIKGIMLNPMQQSEPSKQAIFSNADYAWNIWTGDDTTHSDQVWHDSFKYVDHMSAEETETSTALRELSKHMIHQNTNGNNNYPESVELEPKLTEFQTKLTNNTVTARDVTDMKAEFQTLYDAACRYKAKTAAEGNVRILGQRNADGTYPDTREQMAPWLDCWEEFSQANLCFLEAVGLSLDNADGHNNGEIIAKFLEGQEKLTASESHRFWYTNHYETAMVGGLHIVPFTKALQVCAAKLSQTAADPNWTAPTPYEGTRVIRSSNVTAYENGSDTHVLDGDDSTKGWYEYANSDGKALVGDYIGVDLGASKPVGQVRVVLDGTDRWADSKLQYSSDNETWTDLCACTGNVVTADLKGNTARYVRMLNQEETKQWLKLYEFQVCQSNITVDYQSESVRQIQDPVWEKTEDRASLSAQGVLLDPGQFVGVELPAIWEIEELVANYTAADGLVLEAGLTEGTMTEVAPTGASRAATEPILARFVRIRNAGTKTVGFALEELRVAPKVIRGIEYDASRSDYGVHATYGYQDNRTSGNLFDENLDTELTLANDQIAGKYATFDLGQTRSIKKLVLAMKEGTENYLRQGRVQISLDGETWTDVITVDNNGAFSAVLKDGVAANGTTVKQGVPQMNYMSFVGELAQAQDARYVRIYVTKGAAEGYAGAGRFITAAELLINSESMNELEYVPTYYDPRFITSPGENNARFVPQNMVDEDLTTGFRPDMTGVTAGSLTYRLSGETHIGQINVVQDGGNMSRATVQVRDGEGAWHTLTGTLDTAMSSLMIPEEIEEVFEVKLTWGNVTPTFYELVCVPRESRSAGGQAVSEEETVVLNSYAGDGEIDFDENWKFYLGDTAGAEAVNCNDAAWRMVDLPHDFSIEQEFTTSGEAESGYLPGGTGWYRKNFQVDAGWENKTVSIDFGGAYMDTEVYLNGTKLGEHHYGYTPFSFVLPKEVLNYTGENVLAVKVVNEIPSSRWYSGSGLYRSVHLTVSDPVHVARYGAKITTTNAGVVTVSTAVQNDGAAAAGNVTVKQEIFELQGADFVPAATAVDTDTSAAVSVGAGATVNVDQTLNVTDPKLWNSWDQGDGAHLYLLRTTVLVDGAPKSTYDTEFGFRSIDWDLNTGFKLNGQNVKLKGVCMHHDQGALGAEARYRAMERQVEILRDMGCNAIRVTHNPAADELIEICNRKGMLVIDEAFDGWVVAKNDNSKDFARWFNVRIDDDNHLAGKQTGDTWAKFALQTMIKRDRNAPCVIMYSLGNEVQEGTRSDITQAFLDAADDLIAWAQEVDRTRFLTRGDNKRAADPNDNKNGLLNQKIADAGGIVGFNYDNTGNAITDGHGNGWKMYGSETASHVNSRGVYTNKLYTSNNWETAQAAGVDRLTSYDQNKVGWGAYASEAWWATIPYDYNGGEFVWTGFDYIGEPTPWNNTGSGKTGSAWPKSSFFGIVDTNGLPKDSYYLYRAMWNTKSHTLHVLPTWDEADVMKDSGGKVEVVVYTDAPVVKLYLNDDLVGVARSNEQRSNNGSGIYTYRTFSAGAGDPGNFATKTGHQSLYATFNVLYAPGTLRAVACDANGDPLTSAEWQNAVGRKEVKTTSGASKLVLEADRDTIQNDGRDLSYVTISITDAHGNIVNGATNAVTVSVSGDGELLGLDNGVQKDHTSYQSPTREAGAGQLVAIVQSTKTAGSFTVTATADGLTTGQVTVRTSGTSQSGNSTTPGSYKLARNYYVQVNTPPTLPEEVTVIMTDGTTEARKSVTWDRYSASELSAVGNVFSITGRLDPDGWNLPVSVSVTVVDQVVALLNYSTTVRVGATTANLPASRPAVMADGTVVSAQFGVTWEEEPDYTREGIQVVRGTAQVFGKTIEVTASVRVSNGDIIEGVDVIGGVSDHENGFMINGVSKVGSPELAALQDDNTTAVAVDLTAANGTLSFAYDTSASFYKVKVTYVGSVPALGQVTLAPAAAGQTVSGQTVTYTLSRPVSTANVTLTFGVPVQIAEIELITASVVYPVGATALLDGLQLNGADVPADQLTARRVTTPGVTAKVDPVSSRNVAVTVLPVNSSHEMLLVTESEDHQERSLYTVVFGVNGPSDAADGSRDYPYGQTTPYAPSAQNGDPDGPDDNVTDNDESTFWHSAYNNSGYGEIGLDDAPEKRYIQLTLDEAAKLAGLRYKGRNGNGFVTSYQVWVSNAAAVTEGSKDGFTMVAEGGWTKDNDWKMAEFAPVTAKYVRLYGVTTYGDGNSNAYMSCAELRVVMAPEGTDLSAAVVTVEPETADWTNTAIEPASVTVNLYGRELREGTDYVLRYANNVDPGEADVYADAKEGGDYFGTAHGSFTIVKRDAAITGISPVTVTTQEGIPPKLPEKVRVQTNIPGYQFEANVDWEPIDPGKYTDPDETHKTFTVRGTVEGTEEKAVAAVTVALATTVEEITAVTVEGVAPALPGSVTVHFDDGSSDTRAVTWATVGVSWSVGTVTVPGAVQGITRLRAQARVRVAAAQASETDFARSATRDTYANNYQNTPIFPFALAHWSSGNNNPYAAIDGAYHAEEIVEGSGTDRWCDWQNGTTHESTWLGVAFAPLGEAPAERAEDTVVSLDTRLVNRVKVSFFDENGDGNGAVTYPATYEVEYYVGPTEDLTLDTRISRDGTDGVDAGNGRVREWAADSPLKDADNWRVARYTGEKPAINTTNDTVTEICFETVETAIIRVRCTAKEGSHWVGVKSLEVYGLEKPTANSDFTVSYIKVNGSDKLGLFTGPEGNKTLELELAEGEAIPTVEAAADRGAAVNVIQAAEVPGDATVTITSEDGSKTARYTIHFTRAGGPDVPPTEYTITYDLAGGSVSPANPGTYTNLTPDFTLKNPTRDGYTFAGWTGTGLTGPTLTVTIVRGSTGNRTYTATWTAVSGSRPSVTETTETTEKNPDGSVTVTEVDRKTGTVTVTTTYPDGTRRVTVTQRGGTVIRSVYTPDGRVSITTAVPGEGAETVVKDAAGEVEAQVSLPAEIPAGQDFTDIPAEHWAAPAIRRVTGLGLFRGVSDTTFSGSGKMTRGMMATVLHRLSGEPEKDPAGFEDVEKTDYFSGPVDWASSVGVIKGVGENRFAPNRDLTRQELVTMMYRYAKFLGVDVSAGEEDLSGASDREQVSGWAREAMCWAVHTGLVRGRGEGTVLAPADSATRAEVAVVLDRFLDHLK